MMLTPGPGLVVDPTRARDLSIPVRFDARGIEAFFLPASSTTPVAVGPFVGDVRRGGSCNCETHTFTPHGAGTHTECVGHLLGDRVHIVDVLPPPVLACLLVRVQPVALATCTDRVGGTHDGDDLVVDVTSLARALAALAIPAGLLPEALVIATGPGAQRRAQHWSGTNPPYLTQDAAAFVRARGFTHLLLDLPSVDREDDGGTLTAHRAFFDVAAGVTTCEGAPTRRTVTELCAIDDDIAPGAYALFLQIAPLAADAAPSRPVLCPVVVTDLPIAKDPA